MQRAILQKVLDALLGRFAAAQRLLLFARLLSPMILVMLMQLLAV